MSTMNLRLQYEELMRMYDTGICTINEWNSVGMAPPAENVSALKAVARKAKKTARKLRIKWDE